MTRTAPFYAMLLVSAVVLFTPSSGVPTVHPGVDKLIHAGLFAALALAGRWAGIRPAALAVGLAAYAGVSEVLQAVLPIGRDGTWTDALADVAGVALGLLVARSVAARSTGGVRARRRRGCQQGGTACTQRQQGHPAGNPAGDARR